MNVLFTPEFLLIILIIVTKSAPGDISEEGDKTCWIIDYIQIGNVNITNPPMVSKTVRRAFMKLHDTAMDELCKHNNKS